MQPAKVDAWNRGEFIRREKKKENRKEKEVSLFKEDQGGTTYILKPCVLGE